MQAPSPANGIESTSKRFDKDMQFGLATDRTAIVYPFAFQIVLSHGCILRLHGLEHPGSNTKMSDVAQ